MIFIQLLLLYFTVLWTSIMPLLLPVTIWIITNLINHRAPLLIVVIIIMTACISIWILRYYFDKKMINLFQKKKPPIVHNALRKNTTWKIENLLKMSHNIYVIWCCTAVASWSSIPDMLIIRLVRSKLSIYQWLSSYLIWKMVLYLPIVYATQFALTMMKKM